MKWQRGLSGTQDSHQQCRFFLVLFVYLPFNHFESCLTVRRVGLSPRLRYITASIARKSVTVAEYSFPSGEQGKKKQEGRSIRNNVIAFSHQSNEMGQTKSSQSPQEHWRKKIQLGKRGWALNMQVIGFQKDNFKGMLWEKRPYGVILQFR